MRPDHREQLADGHDDAGSNPAQLGRDFEVGRHRAAASAIPVIEPINARKIGPVEARPGRHRQARLAPAAAPDRPARQRSAAAPGAPSAAQRRGRGPCYPRPDADNRRGHGKAPPAGYSAAARGGRLRAWALALRPRQRLIEGRALARLAAGLADHRLELGRTDLLAVHGAGRPGDRSVHQHAAQVIAARRQAQPPRPAAPFSPRSAWMLRIYRVEREPRHRVHQHGLAAGWPLARLALEVDRRFHVHERQRHELGEAAWSWPAARAPARGGAPSAGRHRRGRT